MLRYSHDAVGDATADLPLHAANGLELDEFILTGPNSHLYDVVPFFVSFDGEACQLELQLLLQSVFGREVLVVVSNTSLMLVHVLVDFEGCLGLGVHALRLLALLLAQLLKLFGSVQHGAHHDLTCHRETCGVHLTEDNCLFLSRLDLDLVAGALEWLLQL